MLEKLKRIIKSATFKRLAIMWVSFWISFALGSYFSQQTNFILFGLTFYSTLELLALLRFRRDELELKTLLREANDSWVCAQEATEELLTEVVKDDLM